MKVRSTLARIRGAARPLAAAALVTLLSMPLAPTPASATKFAGAFMADGGGARALAMGSAFVAVADDASATFWNPAGLHGITRRQVMAMHSERFGDLLDRDFASYVHPLGIDGEDGALAVSVIHLGVDDIPFTSHIDLDAPANGGNGNGTIDPEEYFNLLAPEVQDQIRFESDHEFALAASYARPMGEWSLGGSVKVIRQSVGDFSSFGLGIDLGALRRDWWRDLDVGVKLQDATSTYLSWSTGRNETIAPVLVPGVSYDWSFENLRLDLTLAAATEIHFDGRSGGEGGTDQYQSGSLSYNTFYGLEATLSRRAHLRLGSHAGWDAKNLTFGAGLDLGPLGVDYALAGDVLDIDENTHRVSLSYVF